MLVSPDSRRENCVSLKLSQSENETKRVKEAEEKELLFVCCYQHGTEVLKCWI